MKDLISFDRYNVCPDCHMPTIELYDMKGNRLHYQIILNNRDRISEIIDKKHLGKFKCNKCGREFNTQWIKDLPVPICYGVELYPFLKSYGIEN